MKTTGVRPDEFAASTCPDSRPGSVVMLANLPLPVLNGAGMGALNRERALPPNPDEPHEPEGPAGLEQRNQSEARAGATRRTRSSRAGIHQFQRPKSATRPRGCA